MKARFQEEAYCHPINIGKNWGGKTCNAEAAERYAEVTEPSILANVWNHLHLLREPLWESIKASPQAWWMDKSYFHDNAELKGTINLSPTWFQQGHGVDGREALIHLGEQVEQWVDSDMSSILLIWSSTYSSMSMMVNWETCYHRDINGQDPWYDMLVPMGDYLPLDFVIPMLNLQLCYNPGMIIAFSGSALEHGVGAVDGDRACLAYYMCANVHQSVHIPCVNHCGWMTYYLDQLQLENC
ncbi:hypothetical protein F5J12DRAFT_783627 [Pisolithus orientalis]|uniref:uncharacterized protein n=1 Tax=Pisolithus orientalis TaxID=936130 RepID=UPI0022250AE9|nr:uncharacterized protein F5J12DRAFT_783627 [Pisolithus orientalis]KAI6003183.1 hypothetical protein F5J12DRAFT_783627 [Pisolithus orientalis]